MNADYATSSKLNAEYSTPAKMYADCTKQANDNVNRPNIQQSGKTTNFNNRDLTTPFPTDSLNVDEE